jgi:hypothetical protein
MVPKVPSMSLIILCGCGGTALTAVNIAVPKCGLPDRFVGQGARNPAKAGNMQGARDLAERGT